MSPQPVRGRCLCGAVRFELAGAPRFVAHCHCENCRRAHGAGFVTWAGFRVEELRQLGAEPARYATDTGATRGFCARCGSPLLYASPRWPDEVHVAVASLEDPLPKAPGGRVYADRAPDWCPLTDDLPRYGGATGMEELCS